MSFTFFTDLLNLVFPETCAACNSNLRYSEKVLCTECLIDLPRVYNKHNNINQLEEVLVGWCKYEFAQSLFYYTKDKTYSKLLYNLKYNNRPDIGIYLGELLAVSIEKHALRSPVDYIVPIPLHKKRLQKRGYNQSEEIAKGISHLLSIPVLNSALKRIIHTQTQTNKSREERMTNVSNIFSVIDVELIKHKHILVVDDVITTGATIISCVQTIQQISPTTQISVCSVGLA